MARNVEIKAKIECNLDEMHKFATVASGNKGLCFQQEDTFYKTPSGKRLKLRKIYEGEKYKEELIYYERIDSKEPKESNYIKIDGHKDELSNQMHDILYKCLGLTGSVKKTRTLYMAGQTRIHIDEVEELGNFVELEVVLNEEQTLNEGKEITEKLMEKLHIGKESLLSCAYMDLISTKNKE